MGLFDRFKDDSQQDEPKYDQPSIAEQRAAEQQAAQAQAQAPQTLPRPMGDPGAPAMPAAPAQAPAPQNGQLPEGVSAAPAGLDQFTIRKVSTDGMRRASEAEGWKYQITDDGRMIAMWDYNHFLFITTGGNDEYFQIQSQWKGVVPPERLEEVRQFIDGWHREKLWPTVSIGQDEQGIRVNTTLTVDYEYGVTDAQLLLQMRCAVATSLQVYGELNQMLGVAEGPTEAQQAAGLS